MPKPDTKTNPKYKRVLLKISGESLMGDRSYGLDPEMVNRVAREIKSAMDYGTEVCAVIGGGNIFRGVSGAANGMERATADYMGMLATVINSLALQSSIEKLNTECRVMSSITIDAVCKKYIKRRAERHLEKNRIIVLAAGTGNPYFTTDTAATLRASEMACEAIFKGTKVNGVYNKDPSLYEDAERFSEITYDEVLQKNLKVMDASAIALARDNNLPIVIFSLNDPGGLACILRGEGTYTSVNE